jgi:hypothetical protein
MLQPLYLSGLCLEHREERETILKLLRGIETELGWTASHRVDRIQVDCVARSKQVCIEWMEATVLFPVIHMDNE